MNLDIYKGKVYKLINYWKDEKHIKDANNQPYLEPKEGHDEWAEKEEFVLKLKNVELDLLDKSNNYKTQKDCLLCGAKKISTKYFFLNGYIWQDSLSHYILKHNIKPVGEFIEKIKNFKLLLKRNVMRIQGTSYTIDNLRYVKLDRNQIMILDALMKHGGYDKKYFDQKNDKIFRYSEHAGMLDFGHNGLDKIIISGNTNRVDRDDNEIYMPSRISDILEYEYIFHTHPPTPKPGGRVSLGVLYEFPSISDIFHFISHFNMGRTQGSLVITPEGLYNIRTIKPNLKKILINEDALFRKLKRIMKSVQDDAIQKYGTEFSTTYFYSTISQDRTYIDQINKVLEPFDLYIDFFSREQAHNGKWIVNTIYLPIYVIESTQ